MTRTIYFDTNVYHQIELEGSGPIAAWLARHKLRLRVSESLMTEGFRIKDPAKRRRRFTLPWGRFAIVSVVLVLAYAPPWPPRRLDSRMSLQRTTGE